MASASRRLRRQSKVRRFVMDLLVPGLSRWNGQRLRTLLDEHVDDTGICVWARYPPDYYRLVQVGDLHLRVGIGDNGLRIGRFAKPGVWFVPIGRGDHEVVVSDRHDQELLRTRCTASKPPTVIELRPSWHLVLSLGRPLRLRSHQVVPLDGVLHLVEAE